MTLSMPRVLADENIKEAHQAAKEVCAVAIGAGLFAAVFAGLFALGGGYNTNGGP